MDELEILRKEIDEIDEELVENFEKRMEVVLKIGKYKEEHGLSILNKAREDEVIKKNIQRLRNKELEPELTEFLINLMNISKEIQKKNSI